jgi:hypothetical protein
LNIAARLQVAPEEYLATSFDGTDREYVRGEIVERSMPDYVHGRMEAKLLVRFGQLEGSYRLFACSGTRMQLASDLYRIPDVAVFAGTEPKERVPSHPPLVVIEIVGDYVLDSEKFHALGLTASRSLLGRGIIRLLRSKERPPGSPAPPFPSPHARIEQSSQAVL